MIIPLNPSKLYSRYSFLFLFLLIFSHSYLAAQVQIWGVSQTGGSESLGSVFNFYEDGSSFLQKKQFTAAADGKKPQTAMLHSQDGYFYGITSAGGNHQAGTIFRLSDQNDFQVLYHLNAPTDGSSSRGDMIEISEGVFIGTTQNSGPMAGGTLFKFSVEDGFSVLHSFQSSQGAAPAGGLAYDVVSQTIYGACTSGGSTSNGILFLYNIPNQAFSVLHNFAGSSGGSYPQGGVILASDGNLYGTTQYGGTNNQGSIFQFNPQNNVFQTIYSLNSTSGDGRYPYGKLLEAEEGILAGTCNEGGTSGNGTIFKLTTSGEFTRLRSLSSASTGGYPKAGLCKTADGLMYGITEFGGNQGFGTIYTISLNGDFAKITNMEYSQMGGNAISPLIFDSGQNQIIGATASGGASSNGAVFSLSIPQHSIQKLHDFSMPKSGSNPVSIYREGNIFYGIAENGGTSNTGVFYKMNLAGDLEILHHFNPSTDGQNPNGDLFKANNGFYYGTSRFGGQHNSGTVFKISLQGDFEVVHHFESSAQFPYSGVFVDDDNNIFGTLTTGGLYSDGVLYKIDSEGTFTVLHDFFSYFDGGMPQSSLMGDGDGNLFATTTTGGNFNGGSLYKYQIAAQNLEVVHHFNPYAEGGAPKGRLLLHSNGLAYGILSEDGEMGGGALYRYSDATGLEVLHAFNPAIDGFASHGGLAEDENGKIYGFNAFGGEANGGTCFSYSEESGFELVYALGTQNNIPTGAPALFFPECYDNSDCESSDACSVAICNYGICEEVEINPVFELVSMSPCEVGMDTYSATVKIKMDIHPGGNLIVGDEIIELVDDVWSYTHTFEGLSANGEDIYLNYVFEASGCAGVSAVLGTAPVPCPPVLVHFVLDVGNLSVSNQGIFIGGTFQGWSPAENPMTLNDAGLWEASLEIGAGTYQFNFFNGPTLFDIEYAIGSCATNGKRTLEVGEESETFTFCWGNCNENCSVGLSSAASLLDFEIIPSLVAKGNNLQITLPDHGEHYTFNVLDIAGKTLLTGSIKDSGHEINTSSFSSGMYYLSLQSSAGMTGVKRFVVR